jgi:hypothetical protein
MTAAGGGVSPGVSVVLRFRNAATTIPAQLTALASQEFATAQGCRRGRQTLRG